MEGGPITATAAAIDDGKLATIATAGKVSGAAITSGTIAGSAAIDSSGSLASSGNIIVKGTGTAATELRFGDNDSSNYVGLKAPANVSANQVWTLPTTDGASDYVLSTNGSGVLSWAANPAGTITNIATGTGLSGGPISSTGTISIANTAVNARDHLLAAFMRFVALDLPVEALALAYCEAIAVDVRTDWNAEAVQNRFAAVNRRIAARLE